MTAWGRVRVVGGVIVGILLTAGACENVAKGASRTGRDAVVEVGKQLGPALAPEVGDRIRDDAEEQGRNYRPYRPNQP